MEGACAEEEEAALLAVHVGEEIRADLASAGQRLLYLIQFVDLNVTGIRKILKKHDKTMRWSAASRYYHIGGGGAALLPSPRGSSSNNGTAGGGPAGSGGGSYGNAAGGHPGGRSGRRTASMMEPLLRPGTIFALTSAIEAAFADLRRCEEELSQLLFPPDDDPHHQHQSGAAYGGGINASASVDAIPSLAAESPATSPAQQQLLKDPQGATIMQRAQSLLPKSSQKQQPETALISFEQDVSTNSGGGRRSSSHAMLDELSRQYQQQNAGRRASHNYSARRSLTPDDILMARIYAGQRRLRQSSEFVDLLAKAARIDVTCREEDGGDAGDGFGPIDDEDDLLLEEELDFQRHRPTRTSNALNFLSTILYMTNYYIIVVRVSCNINVVLTKGGGGTIRSAPTFFVPGLRCAP